MTRIQATRYHDFSMGHTVTGHESKCRMLHGHNYRVTFTIEAPELDAVGRVMDFSVIKDLLCEWLEDNWDHRFLISHKDPRAAILKDADPEGTVIVEFNPTAENLGKHILEVIAPIQLKGTDCELVHLNIEETRKCAVNIIK